MEQNIIWNNLLKRLIVNTHHSLWCSAISKVHFGNGGSLVMSNAVHKEALDNCSSGQISFERSSNNFVSHYTKGVNTSTSLEHRCCSKPMTPRTSNKEKACQM
jgi:hypothetical protein